MRKQWWIGGTIVALAIGLAIGGQGIGTRVWAENQPAPVTKESSSAFRKVSKAVLPAVVSIVSTSKPTPVSRRRMAPEDFRRFFDGPFTPEDMQRFFEEFGGEMPDQPRGGFGSGVIIDPIGLVATNNHVVRGANSVEVRLNDGRTFASTEILRDPKTDLAIVKLDPNDAKDLPSAQFGNSDALEIGDWVLAMGSPFGLQGSVTAGIVSAKGRPLFGNIYEDFIQTDAAINPGNSGGPIVNLDGQIVGINSAIRTNSGSFEGIGFAIPANLAKDVLEQLAQQGKVSRGYLGIAMDTLHPKLREKLSLKSGVQITTLTRGETPARKAGLKPGDVVVDVDGEPIDDVKELQSIVTRTKPGNTLHMHVVRDGATQQIPVKIEEQPEAFGTRTMLVENDEPQVPESAPVDALGVAAREVPSALAQRLGLPRGEGVLVESVAEGSLAERAGITEGSIILQVEKQPIHSVEELEKIVSAADVKEGVLIKVRLADGSTKLVVLQ